MPAMLEDPLRPAIYRTSGAPPYPSPDNNEIPTNITIRHVTLRDRITIASLIPFSDPHHVPPRLLSCLCSTLNLEIEKGDTYPMMLPMPIDQFGTYWFQNFGAIMLLGEIESVEQVHSMEDRGERWEDSCLGSFYVKPNYPGRSSHICNGGFLVTEAARNRGVGRLMGEGYLEWAPKLGYTYSVFNLVYETNVASCRIWDALGFKRIGRIKDCGNLRSHPDDLVDAIMYGRDLGPEGEDFVSEERFDKIRYYLKHGTYPSGADRAEKSRLRSAATHYKLVPNENSEGERLMLKDKEVVSDPQRQYEISREVHAQQHGGINKTTATIAEHYHWVRIKETVSLVIKNCADCKESASKASTVRPNNHDSGNPANQSRKASNGNNGAQAIDPNSMIERLVNFDGMEPPNPPPAMRMQRQSSRNSAKNNAHAAETTPAPTAKMQSPSQHQPQQQQQYGDIPLDPQIIRTHRMQRHLPQYHPRKFPSQPQPQSNPAYTHPPSLDNIPNNIADLDHDTKDSIPKHHPDTRMATERHVREGDRPMAYQDAGGIEHDGDGDSGMHDADADGYEGEGEEEGYLDELLTRDT